MLKSALKPCFWRTLAAGIVLATGCLGGFQAGANPTGGSVAQGTASFTTSGSKLTIQTSDRAYINWQSFNIGLGETTTFVQPSSSSLVWNQINDPNPSQILGNLNANGYVVLQNQAGFYVGGQASITAHGLIMTTAPLPMPDLSSGGPWDFSAPPPSANIINYGQINMGKGGSAFLIANNIENEGTISAPQGNIGLYAGKQVLVSERPNGLGLSAAVTLPQGSVDNSGKLIADAGTIAVHAQVVNQGGVIQANSIQEQNGVIELVAGNSLTLGPASVISAKGDTQGVSPGGGVTLQSGNTYQDSPTSTLDVSGGAQGGDGGVVEISAPSMSAINSTINGGAAPGSVGGRLTIDPDYITLDTTGADSAGTGIVSGGSGTLDLNVGALADGSGSAFTGFSQISLQANQNITLDSGTTWNLVTSTGISAPGSQLTLQAGNNIELQDGSAIVAGQNWNVSLIAGTGFVPTALQPTPTSGNDGIYLDGAAYIQGKNGTISLSAANEVQVGWFGVGNPAGGTGSISTTGGGAISVATQYGDVDTGQSTAGYTFPNKLSVSAPFYYSVATLLGGISTAAGGNVTINAGGDVNSFMPSGSLTSDAGTGAFGPEPGNVTITAGGNVFGHYVLANGVGTITAGQDVGNANQNVALSLVNGSWSLNAPNGDIYLQEVRNPNGTLNNNTSKAVAAGEHLFDYNPEDAVNLDAGIGVYLTGSSLPRPVSGGTTIDVPIIYPPTLNITAGAGGINVLNDVILFPSPYGDLNLTTTAGGSLSGSGSGTGLEMSDSALQSWSINNPGAFGVGDHGSVLAELGNPDPVLINISGDMNNFTLITTKQTQINVGGDMINSDFSGENLHASDVTSVNVAGQIFYSSLYSFVGLPQPPLDLQYSPLVPSWASIFYLALSPSVTSADLTLLPGETPAQAAARVSASFLLFPPGSPNPGFVYDSTGGRLGFIGQMTSGVLNALNTQQLTVLVYNSSGQPEVSGGQLVTEPVSWVAPSVIQALYTASQGAPAPGDNPFGLRIGGPGQFDVDAGSISMGNATGIFSCGVMDAEGGPGATSGTARYANLAPVTPTGTAATLNIKIDGDLDILTSTIAALGGGNVNVTSGGTMNLGSQELFDSSALFPNPDLPDPSQRQEGYGIFTTGLDADVNVIAQGDINVESSRIAAYNGGNIFIESTGGSVDAGTGGTSPTKAFVSYVDPNTDAATSFSETVFGSGIVANTLALPPADVPASSTPGNITIETPRGDIIASLGGVLQEALNGNVAAGPTVTLSAGSPGFIGNVDLGDSGVIGGTVNVNATGNITGLVISRQNSDIQAAQNFNGTVLSGGSATLAAGGTATGTVIGVGGVSATGTSTSGLVALGQSVSVNGGANTSTLGTSATASTAATAAAASANDTEQQQVAGNGTGDDDPFKKKGRGPLLAKRVGRVTVILPRG